MKDFKLYGKCSGCKKKKLFISKRTVKLPVDRTATSHNLLCYKCYKEVQNAIL